MHYDGTAMINGFIEVTPQLFPGTKECLYPKTSLGCGAIRVLRGSSV